MCVWGVGAKTLKLLDLVKVHIMSVNWSVLIMLTQGWVKIQEKNDKVLEDLFSLVNGEIKLP